MKKNAQYHMNTGAASVILVLVICALTVFAVLSMRASYHEMKLAEKTAQFTQEYYLLDSRAEEFRMYIEEAVQAQEESLLAGQEFDSTALLHVFHKASEHIIWDQTDTCLTFRQDMAYNGYMETEYYIEIVDNVTAGCNLLRWQVIRKEDTEAYQTPDDTEVWDGDIIIIP